MQTLRLAVVLTTLLTTLVGLVGCRGPETFRGSAASGTGGAGLGTGGAGLGTGGAPLDPGGGAGGALPPDASGETGTGGDAGSGDAGSGGSGGGSGGSIDASFDGNATDAGTLDIAQPTDVATSPDGGMDAAAMETLRLPPPPATWQEHWFEHNQLLELVAYNDDVVIYFDNAVNRTGTDWIFPFATRMWQYTRTTYGEFGTEGRLYLNFHQGKYSGAHSSTHLVASHDFRNVTDSGPGPWQSNFDMFTFEVGRIVEKASNGVSGDPSYDVWSGSMWVEFYQYDLYVALGMTADAQQALDRFTNATRTFPRANTYWFRDWFFPLWRDHGHAGVMVRYFKLLSQHFPKTGNAYARRLNWGEMVHFMSGAANTDLKPLATTAFGWPAAWEQELINARTAFPQITY